MLGFKCLGTRVSVLATSSLLLIGMPFAASNLGH